MIRHYILVFLLASTLCLAAQTAVDSAPKADIIDNNHYYSQSNKQKTYKITDIKKDTPIAVVLKSQSTVNDKNFLTLTVTSGSQKKECQFKNLHALCVLDSVPEDKGSLEIKCNSLPCEVSWAIYQLPINKLQNSTTISELYEIEEGAKRMHLTLTCPNKEIEDAKKLVAPFSNQPIEILEIQKSLYIYFNKPQSGHIFFRVNPEYKSCLEMTVTRIGDKISTQLNSDLVKMSEPAKYPLISSPTGIFRFDIQLHWIIKEGAEKSNTTISITGEKGGDRKPIRSFEVTFPVTFGTYPLSFAIPSFDRSQWSNIQFQIQTKDPFILVDFQLATDDHILVEATQRTVFQLKKGEKLPFRLTKQEHAEKGDKVNIWLSDNKTLTSSKSSCDLGPECDFDISTSEDIKGSVYLGNSKGENKEILILDFKDDMTLTKYSRELEDTFIKKTVEINKALQVTISTGNVMVYMASEKKQCGLPSPTCYDAIGNVHKNFWFVPETQDEKNVIFLIRALDNCLFTMTLLEANTGSVTLEDSEPFSYLLDHNQEDIKFNFHRSSKVDVSFNLVGPLHALDLVVKNDKKLPKDIDDAQVSAEGFLSFSGKENKNDDFSILVRKRQAYKDRYVHFTIVASSTGKQIRLQTGITHYETLPKEGKSNAEYIFEFNKKEDFVINFYSHNVKGEEENIQLLLSTLYHKKAEDLSEEDKKKMVKTMTIDQVSDSLDLSDVSDDLCVLNNEDDSNCEIFMMLQNKMDMEIDIALTLMSRHSVIELKDGIWQSFNLNSIAKTAHFYFYPRNKKDDISMLYKTDDQSIRLRYRMFYGDEESINPAEWPFPSEKISSTQANNQKKFKPTNHMSISKSEFVSCWPYCIVLVSIVELHPNSTRLGSFSLMASNSIMEIPEQQKIDISLKEEEEKIYLVDLKYAISKEKDIYFNVYNSMGLVNIYANVYSERNERIPDQDESDFLIQSRSEMKIPFDKISTIISEEDMDEHNDVYLYVLVVALTDAKISIQFQFKDEDSQSVKKIGFDSLEHVKLAANKSKTFYTSIDQNFQIKVLRTNGFPYYESTICQNKKLEECLEDFKEEDKKGTQILTKVSAYSNKPCQKCYQIFKITSVDDPVEVEVHLQSSASEIELSQSKTVYDFTEKNEVNRYILYAVRDEETFINIDVKEGEIEVEVTDLHKINMNKSGGKLVSLTIPPEEKPEKHSSKPKQNKTISEQDKAKLKQAIALRSKTGGEQTMTGFALSGKFVAFHVTITPKSSNPSIYTITYSSGEREFDLQDGLITDYNLESKKQAVFYYSSKFSGHAYLTISMQKSSYLKDLEVAIKYCEPGSGMIDEDCWTEYSTTKPPVKDKAPNPTLMYSLPAKNYFAVFLTYSGSHEQQVSMGINHQQIMILPYDKDYPFILHGGENVNFLVEVSNPGYIEMTVRKCDESSPTFSYTFDYEGFQDGDYAYQTQLTDNPKNNFISKVKPGTLYAHMESPAEQQSLLSLMVHFSEKKIKDFGMQPGNNGDMTYSIISSNSVELTLHPPVCAKSDCPKKLTYSLMTTTKMRDLYTQLVCPSNFFSSFETVSIDPIKVQEMTPKTNSDGSISFTFTLIDQISYVGVKVANGKSEEIYYKPIQISTFWGQLSRTSHSHKLAISTVFICSLLAIIIFVRRNARRGYKPIDDQI